VAKEDVRLRLAERGITSETGLGFVMKKAVGKIALVALCATALTAIGQSARASTLDLIGSTLSAAPNPLYGTASGENNVVNATGVTSTPSGLFDPTGPNFNSGTTPWLMQATASTTLTDFYVSWFFAGSESGYTISFTAPSDLTSGTIHPISNTEQNQNNNCIGCLPSPQLPGPLFLGTTLNHNAGPGAMTIPFTLTWNSSSIGDGDTNGVGNGSASLIFSYIMPVYDQAGAFVDWELTKDQTDWFAFGLNDDGGGDDNHDDYMGFAYVTAGPPHGPGITPIPAALPLFGSVLGGGFLFGKFRKRRKAGAQRAAV
jgi:hypothetical protein